MGTEIGKARAPPVPCNSQHGICSTNAHWLGDTPKTPRRYEHEKLPASYQRMVVGN